MKNKTDRVYEQRLVNEFFNAKSVYWERIYKQKTLSGTIYQRRLALALNFVNELSLPKTTHALDVGCGAGLMSAALAQKGFIVEAIDSVPAMIELTQQNIKRMGLDGIVHAAIGDAHELIFEDQSFDLIVALGITPWLHNLRKALMEIARVLKSGGYVVLSADNRYRLNRLLDPLLTPAFESIRVWITRELERVGLHDSQSTIQWHMYSIKEFDKYLHDANLLNLRNTNIGFGPFTLFSYHLFRDPTNLKIHQKLQRCADHGFPLLRSTGSQYVVLAKKPLNK